MNLLTLLLSAVGIPASLVLMVGGLAFERLEALKVGIVFLVIGVVNVSMVDFLDPTGQLVASAGLLLVLIGSTVYFRRPDVVHYR